MTFSVEAVLLVLSERFMKYKLEQRWKVTPVFSKLGALGSQLRFMGTQTSANTLTPRYLLDAGHMNSAKYSFLGQKSALFLRKFKGSLLLYWGTASENAKPVDFEGFLENDNAQKSLKDWYNLNFFGSLKMHVLEAWYTVVELTHGRMFKTWAWNVPGDSCLRKD